VMVGVSEEACRRRRIAGAVEEMLSSGHGRVVTRAERADVH
jgi:hypothetical protein